MLMGTLGVVVGAAASAAIVGRWLGPDAWKAYGALAGSWVGGTGNMAAVAQMFDAKEQLSLAVLADTTIYLLWLPVLLASKKLSGVFARFTGVSDEYLAKVEQAAQSYNVANERPTYRDYLYLLAIALTVTAAASPLSIALEKQFQTLVAPRGAGVGVLDAPSYGGSGAEVSRTQPRPPADQANKPAPPIMSASVWRILLLTTAAIGLSFTPLRRIAGSRELSMAMLLLFVARTGATSQIDSVKDQAIPFVLGGVMWIFIHGAFCLLGARIMRVDVGTAAIASAANIGGAASAPLVAAHHNPQLVPASILMALVGYALGNYAGYLAGIICRWII